MGLPTSDWLVLDFQGEVGTQYLVECEIKDLRDDGDLITQLRSDPIDWRSNDVRSYVLDRASKSGRGAIEKVTTSLRAFLRYLAVAGHCQAGL
jgi:hypothetical protein